MGLNPKNDEEEREAILSAFDQCRNIEQYIQDNLDKETTFFIVEKPFWEAWSQNYGFKQDMKFKDKVKMKEEIDNLSLMEPDHIFRMKDLEYNEHFVVLPEHVFFALSKWYYCNKSIERKVIKTKRPQDKSQQYTTAGDDQYLKRRSTINDQAIHI